MMSVHTQSEGGLGMRVAIWIGLLLLVQPGAGAPPDEALVRGTIHDAFGQPAPGAQVTARNLSSGLARSASSSADGRFEIAQLPPGAYQVEIAANGAGTAEPQQVELTSGETRALTFVLAAGSQFAEAGPPEESEEEQYPGSAREEAAAATQA